MEGRGKMLNLPQILGKRVLAERILDILSQSRVDMFICVYFANVPSLETGCFERGFCQGQRMDRGSDSKWFFQLGISKNIVLSSLAFSSVTRESWGYVRANLHVYLPTATTFTTGTCSKII